MERMNVEDLTVESKIDNLKSNFSMNISNFFGEPDIEISEKQKDSDYIKDDQDIYEKILKLNSKDEIEHKTLIEKRDYKKLYKKALEKKIKNVDGIDIKYDEQKKYKLIIDKEKNRKKI